MFRRARLGLMKPEFSRFQEHLLLVRWPRGTLRYTDQTARAYALTVERAMAMPGGLADAFGKADSTSKWRMLRSALLAWASWKGNKETESVARASKDPGVPCRDVMPPSKDDWRRIMRVIEAMPEPRRSAVLLIVGSGLRVGDVFGLSRRHADLAVANRQITLIQKGGKPRTWAPYKLAKDAFRSLLAFHGWERIQDLFDPGDGAERDERQRREAAYHQLRKALQKACADAGVEYTRPHRYRHAVSESALERGAHIEELQRILGHGDIRTTQDFYTHASADRQAGIMDDLMDDLHKAPRGRKAGR